MKLQTPELEYVHASAVLHREGGGAHPCFRNALVLVAPNDEVQESREVALADRVLRARTVLHAVLMQHKYVEPLVQGVRWAAAWPRPKVVQYSTVWYKNSPVQSSIERAVGE